MYSVGLVHTYSLKTIHWTGAIFSHMMAFDHDSVVLNNDSDASSDSELRIVCVIFSATSSYFTEKSYSLDW